MQPINDFSDKYMVPINSESCQTPSLAPHTLLKAKTDFFFFLENLYSIPEIWAFVKNKKQKFDLNFLTNPSIHLYKHTSHEIVC